MCIKGLPDLQYPPTIKDILELTQYWIVEAGFHGKVGKDMRKVKLPEVTKEEAEATFMVLFTTPLKRLGLVDKRTHANTHTRLCYKGSITHTK